MIVFFRTYSQSEDFSLQTSGEFSCRKKIVLNVDMSIDFFFFLWHNHEFSLAHPSY